ncbi:LIM and calponin homology domains-containing protein 1-like isoform X3 [Synchiropus splendidus]|nr:LIM and calponin homology domains-containing protein 1-like isoform X3 [Synchiropus splendidus]XP_053734571.1 LIM and calponin homology domains-containing protein 1-like isoform X3 [Synchiropus splendidus]XP_053734572.1 LIM and calponin homology domains-containing protein 1-like isoform X3 [Synchiropus splendidus]
MRKEAEEAESPKRSIRDSGYIDCWDSERSDSLSPPRHAREDSFDSLDSFGSRSQQTPSPDVPVTRGSSDGRGSDSESDGAPHRKIPDVRKDDMLARRTSVTELRTAMPFNQYLPNKSNQSGYVPTPLRRKKTEEAGRKSWSTATSPVGGDRPLSMPSRSCSEELLPLSATRTVVSTSPAKLPSTSDRSKVTGEGPLVAVELEDRMALPNSPSAAETGGDEQPAQSRGLDASGPQTLWHTDNVSHDPQSLSMIDMRGEDVLQPHSQVRHELMHNQYNRMKEDEDHWQDDLARWKNRRRSISQDLIKKEEERKMMEQLMTGGGTEGASLRRRSIKTYKEIVEDKERREEELRAAYRGARTQEEASAVLQRYAQRFSISEAVLERLQLPKLLDRSVSADPSNPGSPFPLSLSLSSSPTTPEPSDMDPNGPMRYLRQQSAPAPKFTSTLEARVEEFAKDSNHRPQIRSRSSEPPSTRTLSPKPVPLLTPKPYFQFRPSDSELSPGKVDGLLRLNGDISNDNPTTPDSQGSDSPFYFQPSPSNDGTGSSASFTCSPRLTEPQRSSSQDTSSPSRPTSLPTALLKSEEQSRRGPHESALEEDSSQTEETKQKAADPSQKVQSGVSQSQTEEQQRAENQPKVAARSLGTPSPGGITTANSIKSELSTSNPNLRQEFFTSPEAEDKDRHGNVSVPVLPQTRRSDRWSWDPDEERKRQRKWQREQERMLQEKYKLEQEKLKEEWEKAQKEVAEEERRFQEEEQKILQETVTPLTPRSSAVPSPSRGLPSSSSSSPVQDTIVRSLADWEKKQDLQERHSRAGSDESRQRDMDRTSDISTADDSMRTGRSSGSHSQAESLNNLQNGQKFPSTPGRQHELPADGNKAARPAGERRNISTNVSQRSSTPSASCPPPPSDSQPPPPNRSVSGKKLCSSCGQPLGKGAAMIIETLSLYFHINCFKCGVCKGQLGDTSTGTDVRIRNGLLNCHPCYIRSRTAGQPTML